MKKLLSIVALAAFMTACNDSATTSDSPAGDTSTVTNDATMTDTSSVAPAPDASTSTNASTAVKEGMMTMKDAKMMVMKNGAWEKMDEAVTCSNGCKVMTNGEVSKNGKKKMMTEGMMIDKDGQMMDADGKMVDETAWK